MHRRWILYSLLTVWTLLFGYSFFAPSGIAPTNDGFLYGLNRVEIFFRWHISAFAFAVACAFFGRQARASFRRWLGNMPLLIHAVATAVVLVFSIQAYEDAEIAATAAEQVIEGGGSLKPKSAAPSSQEDGA